MRQLTAPLGSAPIPGEAEKRRGLRKMKLVALSFLLGATAIFLAMSFWQAAGAPAWAGYVKAAAEAGMVGALADWFAVTALFRHPLGIKIPQFGLPFIWFDTTIGSGFPERTDDVYNAAAICQSRQSYEHVQVAFRLSVRRPLPSS